MANFIPEEKVTEIRNAADIVDIVSDSVVLKKRGNNYVGLCPFHSEKTPSFTVNQEKQIFYCFGCGTGGNVFTFMMKYGGMTFPETARSLAARYGIEIPRRRMTPQQQEAYTEKEQLYAVNHRAVTYYSGQLADRRAGEKAGRYLQNRKISGEMIDRFTIGHAPDRWDGLMRHLGGQRISESLQMKAGLVVPRKKGNGCYDRFRNRIIFPIRDGNGRVIGFGGRIMDDTVPKYLNSPETPVYNKSRSLYGMYEARQACRKRGAVFVVEGYLDAIALHQHGIDNTVATLGTALTLEHVRMLRGLVGDTGVIYLVYDSDNAGMKAAERSVAVFSKGHAEARILVLPEGYDPDAYIFEFGTETFIQEVEKAQTVVTFLITAATKKYGHSIEGRANVVSELAPRLALVEDTVKRSLYIRELAERTGVDEATVMQKVQQGDSGGGGAFSGTRGNMGSQSAVAPAHRQRNRMESRIVSMMLQFPGILPEVRRRNILALFSDKTLKAIGHIVLEQNGHNSERIPIEAIEDPDTRNLAASLGVVEDVWDMAGCSALINQFEKARVRRRIDLDSQIRDAERNQNKDLLMDLLEKKQRHAMRLGRKSEELRRPD